MSTRPHFIVSDLHLGDKGPRDNFAHMAGGNREKEFCKFLDYVDRANGRLYIIGDLFELWQGNISKVLTCRIPLLDRLAARRTTYLLGNHDIDLKYLTSWRLRLTHPLFTPVAMEHTIHIGDRQIRLIHGHEQDVYCKSEVPGIGRASAIYAGIREDRNGSPLNRHKYGSATVEARSLGHWDRCSNLLRRLCGRPSATQVMRQAIIDAYVESGCDALVFGHTHEPGQFVNKDGDLPIYNSGTWAEDTCSFVRIDAGRPPQVYTWRNGTCRMDNSRLKV